MQASEQDHQFIKPEKKIQTLDDLEKFKKSEAFTKIMEFICKLAKSIESKKISDTPKNPKFDILGRLSKASITSFISGKNRRHP
jgi:hypothetical protein